jgi:hypothetical protein
VTRCRKCRKVFRIHADKLRAVGIEPKRYPRSSDRRPQIEAVKGRPGPDLAPRNLRKETARELRSSPQPFRGPSFSEIWESMKKGIREASEDLFQTSSGSASEISLTGFRNRTSPQSRDGALISAGRCPRCKTGLSACHISDCPFVTGDYRPENHPPQENSEGYLQAR